MDAKFTVTVTEPATLPAERLKAVYEEPGSLKTGIVRASRDEKDGKSSAPVASSGTRRSFRVLEPNSNYRSPRRRRGSRGAVVAQNAPVRRLRSSEVSRRMPPDPRSPRALRTCPYYVAIV